MTQSSALLSSIKAISILVFVTFVVLLVAITVQNNSGFELSPITSCVYNYSFWVSNLADWPVSSLTIGEVERSASYLVDPSLSDFLKELIAAKLNIENGVYTKDAVSVVSAADRAILFHSTALFETLRKELLKFNEGKGGIAACEIETIIGGACVSRDFDFLSSSADDFTEDDCVEVLKESDCTIDMFKFIPNKRCIELNNHTRVALHPVIHPLGVHPMQISVALSGKLTAFVFFPLLINTVTYRVRHANGTILSSEILNISASESDPDQISDNTVTHVLVVSDEEVLVFLTRINNKIVVLHRYGLFNWTHHVIDCANSLISPAFAKEPVFATMNSHEILLYHGPNFSERDSLPVAISSTTFIVNLRPLIDDGLGLFFVNNQQVIYAENQNGLWQFANTGATNVEHLLELRNVHPMTWTQPNTAYVLINESLCFLKRNILNEWDLEVVEQCDEGNGPAVMQYKTPDNLVLFYDAQDTADFLRITERVKSKWFYSKVAVETSFGIYGYMNFGSPYNLHHLTTEESGANGFMLVDASGFISYYTRLIPITKEFSADPLVDFYHFQTGAILSADCVTCITSTDAFVARMDYDFVSFHADKNCSQIVVTTSTQLIQLYEEENDPFFFDIHINFERMVMVVQDKDDMDDIAIDINLGLFSKRIIEQTHALQAALKFSFYQLSHFFYYDTLTHSFCIARQRFDEFLFWDTSFLLDWFPVTGNMTEMRVAKSLQNSFFYITTDFFGLINYDDSFNIVDNFQFATEPFMIDPVAINAFVYAYAVMNPTNVSIQLVDTSALSNDALYENVSVNNATLSLDNVDLQLNLGTAVPTLTAIVAHTLFQIEDFLTSPTTTIIDYSTELKNEFAYSERTSDFLTYIAANRTKLYAVQRLLGTWQSPVLIYNTTITRLYDPKIDSGNSSTLLVVYKERDPNTRVNFIKLISISLGCVGSLAVL